MRFKALAVAALLLIALHPAPSKAENAAFQVTRSGHGRPVLFLPGLVTSGEVWKGVVDKLEPGIEAHMFTLAGFAGVPPVDGPFVETRLAAIETYMKDRNIRDAVVIGHSLGGFLAMKLAIAEPDRIAKVVVIDSAPFLAGLMMNAQAEPIAAQFSGLPHVTLKRIDGSRHFIMFDQPDALLAAIKPFLAD